VIHDGGGSSGPPTGNMTVEWARPVERVPFLPAFAGTDLNYPGHVSPRPRVRSRVELLQAATGGHAVLATAMNGIPTANYALTAPPNTDVRVRAKALSRVVGNHGASGCVGTCGCSTTRMATRSTCRQLGVQLTGARPV